MSTNNEDDGHLPLMEPESTLLFAAGQLSVSELATLLTEYCAKFPEEAARFEEMASADSLEVFTPVADATPLEEYGRRIEDIQRLLSEFESYEITTRTVGLTILLCAPLQDIKSIARRDPYGMFDKVSRRTKQYLHFLQGRRMDGETAKQPAVSSHGGSESSHEKASTDSTLPGTQPPPMQDMGDAANDPTSPRNKSEADACKERDGHRCVVTGTAVAQACHIIPHMWATGDTCETAKTILHDGGPSLELVTGAGDEGDGSAILRLLHDDPAKLHQSWNMLTLSPEAKLAWSKTMFAFKLLEGSEAAGQGHTNIKIQFNWLGKSSARPDDVITLEMLNDPERRALVDQYVPGPGDYILFHQPSAMPVLSGHTVTIRVPDDDVKAFKTAIEMQWAIHKIAALSGAAE